jgi:hypothetical protein
MIEPPGRGCRRRWRIVPAAMLMALLAGCFVQQSRRMEAGENARAAYAHCEALGATGKLTTHVAIADCAIPKVIAAYTGAGYPFMDLVYISTRARHVGAERVDAGTATETELKRDLAALDARIAAEEERRLEIEKYGGRVVPVSADVLVQGLNAFAPAPTAAALPPGSPPSCFNLGGEKRCN